MSLRLIPNMTVIRPGRRQRDRRCLAGRAARINGPTLPGPVAPGSADPRYAGAKGSLAQGGYVLRDSDGDPDIVLIGTGSEVELAVGAPSLPKEDGIGPRRQHAELGALRRASRSVSRERARRRGPTRGSRSRPE